MPELNPKAIRSNYDYKGPTVPDYNLGEGFKQLGASDTQLGRLIGGNYFDEGFYPYSSQQDQRYANQGKLNAAGNTLAAIGSKTFLVGIPSILGTATSLLASPLALAKGTSLSDVFENNPLNRLADYVNKTTDELTPRFQRSDFDSLSFTEQLARPGELISANAESLAFMAQSFVPAALLSKAAIGAKLADRLSKSRPAYQALSKINGANTQAVANAIDFTTSLSLLSTNEAALEAVDGKKQVIEKLNADRWAGKNQYTDEQIEEIGNKGFQNVFWNNMVYTSITNGIFQKMLMPMYRLPKSSRANEIGLRLIDGKLAAPKYNRITSFLFDKTNVSGAVSKSLAADTFTEGLEESIQYSIQNAAAIDNKYTDFASSFGSVISDITSGEVLNLSDKERGKAFGLGALMGGGATAIRSFIPTTVEEFNADGTTKTSTTTIGAAAEARKLRQARESRINNYNKAYTDLVDHSFALRKADEEVELSVEGDKFFKKTSSAKVEVSQEEFQKEAQTYALPETGGKYIVRGAYDIDDEGKIKVNSALVNHVTNDAMEAAEIADYMDLERVSGNPDRIKQTIYRNMLLANLANQAFKAGTAGILNEQLDMLIKGDAQRLAEFGVNQEDAQMEVERMKDYISRLESIYNTASNSIIPTANTDKGYKDAEVRRRAFYRKAAKAASLDSLIVELDDRTNVLKEAIVTKYQSAPDIEEKLNKVVTKHKILDEVDSLLRSRTTSEINTAEAKSINEKLNGLALQLEDIQESSTDSEFAQYAGAVVKRDALVQARETLGKEVDRILSAKQWKAAPKEQVTAVEHKASMNVYEGMTSNVYKLLEDRVVRNELLLDQFAKVRSDVHADLIEQLVLDNPVLLERGQKAASLVRHLIDSRIQLEESSIKLLSTFILSLRDSIISEETKVVIAFDQNLDSLVSIQDFTPDQAAYAEDSDAALAQKSEYDELQNLKVELGDIFTSPQSVISQLYAVQDAQGVGLTDRARRVRVARQQLLPTSAILSVSKFDAAAGTIDENYTDITSVDFELNKLKILSPIFRELEYLDTARDTNVLVAKLTKVRELVLANLHNKEAIDKRETEHYANGYAPVYRDILPKLTLTAAQKTLLEDLLIEDPYSASLIITDLAKTLQKPVDYVEEAKQALAIEFNEFYYTLPLVTTTSQLSSFGKDIFPALVNSPVKVFSKILNQLSRNAATPDAALDRFSKDLNISKFLDTPSVLTQAEKERLVALYTRASALNQLSYSVNSSKDSMYYLSTMDKYLKEQIANKAAGKRFGFPPSFGQERVIKELMNYNSGESKTNVSLFDNVIAIKALPGAGKSSVIAPATLSLLGIKPNQVLTAANKQEAANNIASTTGSGYAPMKINELTEAFRTGTIGADVTTIIVDEIGGASMKDVYDLMTAFALFQNNNMDRSIRMWVIYDPNQTNTSQFGQPRIEYDAYTPIASTDYIQAKYKANPTAAELALIRDYETGVKVVGGYLPLVHNMQSVTPMVTSYRSNVAMIVDTMNEFLSSIPVTNKLETSTSTTLDKPSGIQGVYAAKLSPAARAEKITEAYLDSAAVNTSRNRIIVVGNDVKKDAYTKLIPSAKVLTPMEAAGMSVSEVYIDVDPSDNPDYANSPLVYNQAMFTAVSRAQDFVMMTNQEGTNNIDSSINQKAEETAKKSEANFDAAVARKKAQIDAYKTFFGTVSTTPVVTPTPVVPNPVPITPAVPIPVQDMDDSLLQNILDEVPPSDEIPSPRLNNADYVLKYPQTDNLSKFKPEDEIYVIKDDSNGKQRFVLAKPEGNTFVTYAILGDEEIADFETTFGVSLDEIEPFTLESDPRFFGNFRSAEAEPIKSTQFKTFYYVAGSHGVRYKYANEAKFDFNEPAINLFKSWAKQFFGNPEVQVSNYAEVLSNPADFIKVRIHTEREAAAIGPAHKPFHPYLVISGLRTTKGTTIKDQYIRLRPTIFNVNGGAANRIGFKSVQELTSKLNKFTTALSSFYGKDSIYGQMRPGFKLEVDPNNIYFPFAAFVRSLATGEAKFASDEYNAKVAATNPAFTLPPTDYKGAIPNEIVELAKEIYLSVHTALDKQDYKGPAQLAYNRLAATNFSVTLPNGELMILRDYPGYAVRNGVNYAVGKSLIGRVNFEHDGGKSVNPIPSPKFIESLTDAVNGNSIKGLKHAALQALLTELEKGTPVHIPDITLEQMNELFVSSVDSEGNMSKISEGFGLRTPLNFQIFGKDMRLDDPDLELSGYLESTFEGVNRPTVMVSNVPGRSTSAPAIKAPKIVSDAYKTVNRLRTVLEEGTNTFEEASRKLAAEGLTLDEALYNVVTKDLFYTRRSTAITTALKKIGNLEADEITTVEQVLETSKTVTDRGKVGSRDYIRAFILSKVFKIPNEDLLVNLDKARKFWIVERNDKTDTEKAFDEELRAEFDAYVLGAGMTQGEFLSRLSDVRTVFAEVLSGDSITIPSSATRMLDMVNEIVLATSKYRTTTAPDARPIDIALPDLSLNILKEFKNIVEENGATSVEAKNYFKDNKVTLEKYGITLKMSDDQISTRVDELVVERSMTAPKGVSIELDITEEEGRKVFRNLNPPTLFSTIGRLFNRGRGEVFNMVSAAHMQQRLGKNNWGLFKNGIVYVLSEDGKTSSKVIRHETFHKVFWSYLTPVERIKVLELAKQKYGNKDQVALEEDLANDFMKYKKSKKGFSGKLAEFFRKILRFFGFTYNNLSSIELLFDQIDSGLMSKDIFPHVERDLAERWPTNEQYNLAKTAFFNTFERIFYDARNNPLAPLYSFDEAVDATITELRKVAANPTTDPVLASALQVLELNGQAATAELINKFFYSTNVKALRQGRVTALKRQRNQVKDTIAELRELDSEIDSTSADSEDQINALEEDLLRLEASINEEIIQSDLVNPNDKISGRVKQRLISVAYKKNGRTIKGDYYSVFNALLPMLSQADTSSLAKFEASIYTSIGKYKNAFSEETPSNVRKAAAKFMDEVFTSIKRFSIKAPTQATFFKDVSTNLEYLIVSNDGSDTRNITRTLALANPNRYTIIERLGELGKPTYQTLDNFVIMAAGMSGLTIDQLRNSYYLFEELSFVKSLIGSTASLVRTNSFVASSKYENYRYVANYAANRLSGASSVLETQVVDNLINYAYSKNTGRLLDSNTASILRSGTPYQKVSRVLSLLNLPSIKEADYTEVYLSGVAESIALSLIKMDTAFASLGAEKTYSDIYELVQDEGTLTSALADLLTSDSSATEINNFIRGDGKRAYAHRDASYQSSLLNFFARKNKKAGRQFSYVRYDDRGNLVTDSVFAKDNIFIKGANKIFAFIDHDSIKIKGREKRAKYLYSEGALEHVERTFKFGFLDRIRSSKSGKYYQFLPIPSNRRTISALEVNVLNNAEIEASVERILQSQMERPIPSTENGLANVANYKKRYQQWTFPGLDGKISGTLAEAKKKVLQHIENKSIELADSINSTIDGKPMRLDDRSVDAYVLSVMKGAPKNFLLRREYDAKMKELRTKRRVKGVSDQVKAEIEQQITALENVQKAAKYEVIKHAAKTFYGNHVVNQYSLSQLIYGDEVFYKSKEDETKRIQGATGSGDVHLVDTTFGLPNISVEEYKAGRTHLAFANRVIVMDDVKGMVPSDLEFTRLDSYRDSFDETDAQGYILPELYEQYAKAAGVEANTDLTLKPLYFNVTKEGIPVLIKYSIATVSDEFTEGVKVLSDDALVDRNGQPIQFLVDMRNKMRKANAGMLVFSSGVKLGRPVNTAKVLDTGYVGSHTNDEYFHEDNIITIDNNFLRFQLNPSKEVDVDISNPSQLTAFVNTNGQSPEEMTDLYNHNATLIRLGQLKMDLDLGVSPNGNITKSVIDKVRYEAGQATSGTPGSEVVHQMLTHTDASGEYTASLNNPLIQDKFVSVVSSMATNSTVGFRINGSKLVLQAEFGTYSAESSRLKWKDEEGYTEVLLPESYREFFNEGDKVGMSSKKNLVGFRIPSSNLHSGIALKVKGFYKVPAGSEGNVVIAPSLVVYVHGSDFDIDSLFVIRKETSTKDINLNDILSKYRPEHNPTEHFNVKKGQDFGTTDEAPFKYQNQFVHEYLEEVLYDIYTQVHVKTAQLEGLRGPSRKALLEEIKSTKADFNTLNKYAQVSSKNSIVHTFADVLLAEKNRVDINTPISLARVTRAKGSVREELMSLMRKEEFVKDLVTAKMITPNQFTTDELVEMASSGDLSAVTPEEPNTLAQKILTKYNWRNLDDSVMEMLANQHPDRSKYSEEFLTNDQIDSLLYPPGQLTDFGTQQAIHSNTYSGVKLTGIAANSAKTIAYVFGMSLDAPKLKQAQHLRINNGVFDSFSRSERVWKNGDWVLPVSAQRAISIFETLDTILNLAIDNVKEQKLSFLGITNNNANLYLTAIAYGVPLNTIVRMFTSPVAKQLSSKGRITNDSIDFEQYELSKNFTPEFLEKGISGIGGDYLDIKNRIDSLMSKNGYDFPRAAAIILGRRLFVSDEVLDSISKGTVSTEAKVIHNFVLLEQFKSLVSTGEELFKYSQILGLLRGIPNTKWKMDYIAETFLGFMDSPTFKNTKASTKASLVYDHLENFKSTSLVYQTANEEDKTKLVALEEEAYLKSSNYKAALVRAKDIFVTNAISDKQAIKEMQSSDATVFENVFVGDIPHVMEAFKSLQKVRRLIEHSLGLHSPTLKQFARSVYEEANVAGTYINNEQFELIQKELVRLLSSDLKFHIYNDLVDLTAKPNTYYNVPSTGVTLEGHEAESQILAKELRKAKVDYPNNFFLQNVEISLNSQGVYQIGITADKSKEEEVTLELQAAFDELMRNEETKWIGLKLFKHEIVNRGLLFGRTAFSMLFPPVFLGAFTKALDARLDNILGVSSEVAAKRLDNIKASFIMQYLRNNPETVRFLPKYKGAYPKPIVTGYFVSSGGSNVEYRSGKDQVNGVNIYYDLKYDLNGRSPEAFYNIIKTFGEETYIKIHASENNVYYRLFTKKGLSKHYKFNDSGFSQTFDISTYTDPRRNVLKDYTYLGTNSFVSPIGQAVYSVGETVELVDNYNAVPEKLTTVEVTNVETRGSRTVYAFKVLSSTSLIKERPIDAATERSNYLLSSDSEAMAKLHNGVAVNAQTISLETAEQAISDIFSLPLAKTYFIDANILDPFIANDPDEAAQVAQALLAKTGYTHPILKQELTEQERLFQHYRNTVMDIKSKIKPVSEEDVSTGVEYSELNLGDVVWLGVNTHGENIYGRTKSIGQGSTIFTLLNQSVFNSLTSSNISVEELENIKQQIHC